MSRELPEKPNLEHLKKQAKELLRRYEQGEPDALERLSAVASGEAKLADAQHAVAREYGFANWAELKERVESLARGRAPGERLAAAVRASDAAAVARVIEEHPELKDTINEPMAGYGAGMQALIAAVQRTDRKTIDVLLANGANIHERSRWWAGGIGVLDECLPELAEFLMERGAVVDAHSAARLGMFERLRELVGAQPALVHARGYNGQTPLHYASTMEIAQYLVEQGAEIDVRDLQHESTAAQHMLRVIQARHFPHDRQEIARFLVERGCRTDVFMGAALGDAEIVRRNLEADPGCVAMRVSEEWFPKQDSRSGGTIYIYQFGRGRTPHQVARDFEHEDVFQLLMSRSPEEVKLGQACELGDESLFRQMLARRPELVTQMPEEVQRRLPGAAQNNNAAAVRLMLGAGWPVNARGELGMTALEWASWHGNAEIVRDLLLYSADVEAKDNAHGITALGSALHGSMNGWHRDTGDYVATVEALLDAGAKAPRVTEDLEASEAVKDVLERREEAG